MGARPCRTSSVAPASFQRDPGQPWTVLDKIKNFYSERIVATLSAHVTVAEAVAPRAVILSPYRCPDQGRRVVARPLAETVRSTRWAGRRRASKSARSRKRVCPQTPHNEPWLRTHKGDSYQTTAITIGTGPTGNSLTKAPHRAEPPRHHHLHRSSLRMSTRKGDSYRKTAIITGTVPPGSSSTKAADPAGPVRLAGEDPRSRKR